MTITVADFVTVTGHALSANAPAIVVPCLQLCQASYAATPSDIPALVDQVEPMNAGCTWHCLPDSIQFGDDANLAFVAQYSSPTGQPLIYAVVVRGTDFDVPSTIAILEEVVEDLDVIATGPAPWSNIGSGAQLSNGTLDAYATVDGFAYGSDQLGLIAYVVDLVTSAISPAPGLPLVVVTGHSLGACLASAIAPAIAAGLIIADETRLTIPVTFAGPTAGNAAFASMVTTLCPKSFRYVNDRDMVPSGWAGLATLPALYDGWDVDDYPLDVEGLVDIIADYLDMADIAYVQPDDAVTLTGAYWHGVSSTWPSWSDEAEHQHHTTTYMALLGGTNLPNLPYHPMAQPLGRQLGSIAAPVGEIVAVRAPIPAS